MPSPSLQEIKQRVEILEKELSLFGSLLEILQDSFFILDQKGAFLRVNSVGERMLGYPWEELQKMVFLDYPPVDSRYMAAMKSPPMQPRPLLLGKKRKNCLTNFRSIR